MSTQISNQAEAAREAHRGPGGKFGTQPAAEANFSLDYHQSPYEPHDSIAAPIEELRDIDNDERELFEAGIKPDSRAVRALAEQRKQILGDMLADAEHVELDDVDVPGKVIAYAKDGTIVFTDGSYSRADGPFLPCGHDEATPGCGGCDPGAVETVIEDGSTAARPFDPHRDAAPDTGDPRVQAGEVFDRVTHPDYGTLHRRRDGVVPSGPHLMRFQSDRPLSDEEVQQAAQIIGYAWKSTVAGDPVGEPGRDSPYSFLIAADSTRSRRTDRAQALLDFEQDTTTMLSEGTPVRQTTRKGYWTQGTRLVEGFGDNPPNFEVYYDSVSERSPEDEEHAALNTRWNEAFSALRKAGLSVDADHPVAKRYREASYALNNANRGREATGPTGGR